jgi:hypothetical protein
MKRHSLPLVTLLVLGWSLRAAEASAQAPPPRQLQATRLLERFGCVLDEPSLVILVCSALQDGKWVGAAPCGFDVAKCSQPQWAEFLRTRREQQRSRMGDDAPHSGETGDSTLRTDNGAIESVSVTTRDHESLDAKLKRIRRLQRVAPVQWNLHAADHASSVEPQWILALQTTYVADGCADDSDSMECESSSYQQFLREVEADESFFRTGGK